MKPQTDWNKEYRELHELGLKCARCQRLILSSSVDLDGETVCIKCFTREYKPGRYKVSPKEERTWNGITFHSAEEMNNHIQFDALLRAGQIVKLERQVPFWLYAAKPFGSDEYFSRFAISKYVADHVVTELDGEIRIYETKGHRSAGYKLAKKWFGVCHPDKEIIEI